jgi:AcrR family transcriptional regulator
LPVESVRERSLTSYRRILSGVIAAKQRTPQQRPAAETREHVLEVASDLFYWHGIRATGVDRVAAAAGVAPTTLYRLFASKDDLVAAYVERADRLYRGWFTQVLDSAGPEPRQRILALFDALIEQVKPAGCRGCPFQMGLAELPDASAPAHRHAVATKRWVRKQLRELTGALEPADPALADQLWVLMEGVYAAAQSHAADRPARQVRKLVESLLPR